MTRLCDIGAEVGEMGAVRSREFGRPFDAIALGDLRGRRLALQSNAPEVAAIDIAAIGIEEDGLFVGRERPLFDFAITWS